LKIILIGTGASQNIPAFRCTCPVCSQARTSGIKKYRRKNSSAVVEISKGEKILIDAPPQFLSQLEECSIDDREINHLLLSHRHDDHLLGLFYLFSLKKSKGAVIDRPIEIYHGAVTGEYLFKKFHSLSDPERLKLLEGVFSFNEISELESFTIGSSRVHPLETNHLKMKSTSPEPCRDETFGFMISEKGKKFCYLVDAAEKLPEQTLSFLKAEKPDCIIIDCTYGEENPGSGHGDTASVIDLRKQFPEGRMIISHMGHKNFTPDMLERLLFPAGIEVGYDGMEIIL